MNRATRIIVATMGVMLGIAGLNHGFFETIQGNTPTNGLIIQAIGKAKMITTNYIKPGATVMDVGINPEGDKFVGDVDTEPAKDVAGAITPVAEYYAAKGDNAVALLWSNVAVAFAGVAFSKYQKVEARKRLADDSTTSEEPNGQAGK